MFPIIFLLLIATFVTMALALNSAKPKQVRLSDRIRANQASAGTGGGGASLRDAEEMDKSLIARVILPLSEKWSKNFSKYTPVSMVAKADQAINEAGMVGKVTGLQLMTICWILGIGLPIFFGLLFLPHITSGRLNPGLVLLVCFFCVILGYRLPLGVVQGRAKQRKKEILRAMPFTMDLISVSVSAGMAFDGAMDIVSQRTQGALSEELKRTLREINLGIARADALNNLATRCGVDDLRGFITAVNFISKLGGSLTDVIMVQTEALRVKRTQRAETLANQAPVKIMIPLVLFILPCVFIVILGPAAVRMFTKSI